MKNQQRIAIGLLLFATSVSFSEELSRAKGVQLLVPGDCYAEDVSAPSNSPWVGLFPKGKGSELRLTHLHIDLTPEDVNNGTPSGKKISATDGEAIFLVPESLSLKLGPVSDATNVSMTNGSLPYTILFSGIESKLSVERTKIVLDGIPGEKLKLSTGQTSQIIYAPEHPYAISPEVLWAGDLDHDGRVDLLLRITDNDKGSFLYALFLSSAGKPLGANVAEWRTHGD